MWQCHIQRASSFLIPKANWILCTERDLEEEKWSSSDYHRQTVWLLPGATDRWMNNEINKSHASCSIWPLCKLKSVKQPTRRDFVIEPWLAKRLCICHKKLHKWVNSEWLDRAQCASFSSKVTMCNMKMNYQSFSQRYLLSLLSFAKTKCVRTHKANRKWEDSKQTTFFSALVLNCPFRRWRHLCLLFLCPCPCPSIFAKATSIIRNRWVSTSAACVPSDSLLSYLVLAAEDISPAFPIWCC